VMVKEKKEGVRSRVNEEAAREKVFPCVVVCVWGEKERWGCESNMAGTTKFLCV